jgi:hypothetical protein
MAETHRPQSLTFGTMRMLEVERSQTDWLMFLPEIYEMGIKTLHSSHEYDSFQLLSALLSEGRRSEAFPEFRHIAKLAEPSFDDGGFDGARFEVKVRAYLAALSTPILHDVQWMWRHDLKDDVRRVQQFTDQLDQIGDAVDRLKRDGLIERFFCFPYSIDFGAVAVEHEAIDGLIVYRNRQETDYDPLIDRSYELGKPVHVIRPFNAGAAIAADERTPAQHAAFALGKPAIESAILSSNTLAHLRELTAVVRPLA